MVKIGMDDMVMTLKFKAGERLMYQGSLVVAKCALA